MRAASAPSGTKATSPSTTKASATYSSGLATLTDAQRTAKPFLSGGQAKAQGVFDSKAFQSSLTAYTKGDVTAFDQMGAMLAAFDKAGGNVTPYIQQVYRQHQATIAAAIKAYAGPDRATGQTQRAEWLRRMGDITPDLAGLKALRALWREVLPQVQKAA